MSLLVVDVISMFVTDWESLWLLQDWQPVQEVAEVAEEERRMEAEEADVPL